MSLVVKIKPSVTTDYKSIVLTELTGTGVTGYGANQDPVGYRRAISMAVDIIRTNIFIGSPTGVSTSLLLDATQSLPLNGNTYTVTNINLGYPNNGILDDGLWKIEFVPFFTGITMTYNSTDNTINYTASVANNLHFVNATWLYITQADASTVYVKIDSIDTVSGKIRFSNTTVNSILGGSIPQIGLGTIVYVPVAKEIKEFLDGKVADMSVCECSKADCDLVSKYLLYDSMFINCQAQNPTKAQQIFDLLTAYSTDDGNK